jgi:hypothetical protein
MDDRLETNDENGGRSCQAEGCSLPPSLLPWTVDVAGHRLELWLCHPHGRLLSFGRHSVDADGEAA